MCTLLTLRANQSSDGGIPESPLGQIPQAVRELSVPHRSPICIAVFCFECPVDAGVHRCVHLLSRGMFENAIGLVRVI